MIDLDDIQRGLRALPGEMVRAPKAQLDLLIEEARQGQQARRRLAELQKAGVVPVAA